MLRHTFGTDLADQEVPVARIRDLMEHASIGQTNKEEPA
jgi:site-specific recombinase XerD